MYVLYTVIFWCWNTYIIIYLSVLSLLVVIFPKGNVRHQVSLHIINLTFYIGSWHIYTSRKRRWFLFVFNSVFLIPLLIKNSLAAKTNKLFKKKVVSLVFDPFWGKKFDRGKKHKLHLVVHMDCIFFLGKSFSQYCFKVTT